MGNHHSHDAEFSAYASSLIKAKARQLSRNPVLRGMDEDDIAQELRLALLRQQHLYDPCRGASEDTFADRVIRSGIAMMIRDRGRQKRAPDMHNVSLEKTNSASDEEAPSMRNNLTENDLRRRYGESCDSDRTESIDAVWEILQSLPAEDQEICRLRMEGSDASVAQALGISRRQVRENLDRLRKRFEAGGFDDF
ncbi:MAG: sigma-70 family RNA polymerase sigma factor [Phycisphaerales bacterium]|nr:sigma-70 family RNA polymerase sigma factor [Phycisphaerales bacterium]